MSEPDRPLPDSPAVTAGPSDPGAFVPVPVPVSVAVPPSPPARRRRTGRIVGAVVVMVVLVASGVAAATLLNQDKAVTSSPTATSQPPVTVAATATATVTAAKYTGTLQALAIPIPAGAARESLRMGAKDGTLDLNGVLEEYEGNAKESVRNQLTSLEFERGLFLAWTDAKGFLIYVQIYQFHYERQAAAWSAAEDRGLTDIAESTAAFDEILGGRWFVTTTPNGRSAVHANYSKGDLAVMISIFRTGKADVDYLKRLAIDQYQNLP